MVSEEIQVSLSGGGPWGFRLQGGAEQQRPLQVAKVRRRSKACRAGLKEQDELLTIGDRRVAELSHAQAMSLIDAHSTTLSLRVKRTPSMRLVSPPDDPLTSQRPSMASKGITSPPDSEAYYGETDSDADTQSLSHRRQRRTPPHARSPSRYDRQDEEETSEMSGYESATDAGVSLLDQWDGQNLLGVPRRELVYQPPQTDWTTPTHTPHTLTPRTLTPPPDQGLAEAEGEGDSGFQEVSGCAGLSCPPLVSPDRAREALMLGSSQQLVPMVGPQQSPVNDQLSTTYVEKARQAKLHRGESVVEKQVKEARSKCRSIASLLTDAPNPNSKGVLMFKKRRQRAKKYTLTCFGKVEGDKGGETEGETGGETEEEGGSSILSGSEVDEGGFSASFDPTWDSGYLDVLDRRSSACPSTTPTTPTTPTANHGLGLDFSACQTPGPVTTVDHSPGLEGPGLDSSAYQSPRLESSITKQPILDHPASMSPSAVTLTNGGSVAVSRASLVLGSPSASQNGQHGYSNPMTNPNLSPGSITDSDHHLASNLGLNPNVLNRTARPFTPGQSPSRPSVTSVMFRPPQTKPTTVMLENKPVSAISMMTISPAHHQPVPDVRRAVSSTSLYIPARNSNGHPSINSPPSALSPPPGVHAPPSTPMSPPVPQPSAQPFFPPPTQHFTSPSAPAYPPPPACVPGSTISPPYLPEPSQISFNPQPAYLPPPHPPTQPSPSVQPYINMAAAVTPGPQTPMANESPPQAPASDSLATREQRISVPAARTGILQEARRRAKQKPMFCSVQNKDISPNPDLLSMVQNLDDHFGKVPCAESAVGASVDAGHESGPEEDWLRLGAEACNFMQAQRGPRPPPVAPKPKAAPAPQLGGKGGQLFARRQSRMDRYVVDRSPSVAADHYSPAQTREPSPTPSLPATWKYSSNIRAPPPINYNPLLSPSCPPKAQKKPEVKRSVPAGSKGQKAGIKPVDLMNHQPYQLNSSLFNYGGAVPQNTPNSQMQQGGMTSVPHKTARVYEVKRFSTPPPTTTGPALKVIVPRSATTLGEPMWRSDLMSSPPTYQPQPQWTNSPLSPTRPPPPTAPLPQLPTFSSPAQNPVQSCTFSHIQPSSAAQSNMDFKSAPDLSPFGPTGAPQQTSCSITQLSRVPRPRFSTSNLGLQPCVWRPGSTMH